MALCDLRVLVTAALLLAASVSAADPLCASMGKDSTAIVNQTIPSCLDFYTNGSAIRVPNDSATVKYGIVSMNFMGTGDFIDRTGKEYPASTKYTYSTNTNQKVAEQVVVKTTFSTKGAIVSITPILYVPFPTMVKPFTNLSFIGNVTTWSAPTGVAASYWFRWDFGSAYKGSGMQNALQGNFTTLLKSVKDGSGKCQAALCKSVTSATCTFFQKFTGKSMAMGLYWDPAMHAPGDSELVPLFSSGINYMTGNPHVYELLSTNVNLKKTYVFGVHGNPIGSVYQFTGVWSKQKPPTYC